MTYHLLMMALFCDLEAVTFVNISLVFMLL